MFPRSSVPEELAALLEPLASSAPRARVDLDQSHCTVETKARRACFLHERGALDGRRVLLLGDDDLTALAFRLGSLAIRELTIVDVDPVLLTYLERKLRGAPFPTRLVEHDLRLLRIAARARRVLGWLRRWPCAHFARRCAELAEHHTAGAA